MMGQLKERQEKFCQAYLISRNATSAAKEAGYSERSAYNQGYELLKKPEIQRRKLLSYCPVYVATMQKTKDHRT
jgi:phage terminase small subunit